MPNIRTAIKMLESRFSRNLELVAAFSHFTFKTTNFDSVDALVLVDAIIIIRCSKMLHTLQDNYRGHRHLTRAGGHD